MATRKHIQLSEQGEEVDLLAKQREEIASQAAVGASNEVPVGFRIFKLVDTKRGNMPVIIQGIIDIYNPESKRKERVRILKGHPEVWQSKQKDISPEYIRANRATYEFQNKTYMLNNGDSNSCWLFENHPCNVDSPNKEAGRKYYFYEWNPERQAKAEREMRLKKVDAIKAASTMPVEKMRKHALYLGISFSDDVGMPKTDDAIRNDYELYAEAEPERFMQSADSKDVEISFLVKKAIQDARIDLGRQPNQAFWADGGVICRIPVGRKEVDYLIELALTNSEDGKRFLEQLQGIVLK